MRNILSFHKVDYSKVIDSAIQTCLADNKACMSMSVNKGVGGLSKVKLASDQSRFGYIVDPAAKGHNWQTTGYNATSTVYDEYWEWGEYDNSGTRIDTLRKSQWGYSTMGAAVADCGVHNFSSATFVYLPKGEERSRQSFEYDIGMGNYGLASIGVGGKYFILWHRSSENSRQSAGKTYVWNSVTGGWNVSRFGSSYCRYGTVKYYETDDVCRIYYKGTWNNVSEDYWGGYIDVNRSTGEMSSFTSMTQADVEAIQNNYPNGYYSDLTNMTLLTNYEEYSGGCYFNGNRVGESGYFQRGRDNKAMEYIFRPVNLVQPSGSSSGGGGALKSYEEIIAMSAANAVAELNTYPSDYYDKLNSEGHIEYNNTYGRYIISGYSNGNKVICFKNGQFEAINAEPGEATPPESEVK